MTSKCNILLLSVGRRVELMKAFKTALGEYFPAAKVFATDLNPSRSSACYIADRSFAAPKADCPDYVDFLLELCQRECVGMVVPTIDTELQILALNQERFDRLGIQVIISKKELVMACRDKRKTRLVYELLDIEQPKIYSVDELIFPCFCKPYDGSSSAGAFIVTSAESLNSEILQNDKNMFMELVDGEYKEYTIDAYYDCQSQLRCLVPRERLEVRAGEVSKGVTRKNFVYDFLLSRLKFLRGARGCITVQVFANPENCDIKALEINPRFGGGFPLTEAAGANYPEWLIREYFLNEEIEFFDGWDSDLLMLRYDAKVIINENEC